MATALFKELIAGLFSAEYRPTSQRNMAVAARHPQWYWRFRPNCRCPWMSGYIALPASLRNLWDLSLEGWRSRRIERLSRVY